MDAVDEGLQNADGIVVDVKDTVKTVRNQRPSRLTTWANEPNAICETSRG